MIRIADSTVVRQLGVRLLFLTIHTDVFGGVLPLVGFFVVMSLAAAKPFAATSRHKPVCNVAKMITFCRNLMIDTCNTTKPPEESKRAIDRNFASRLIGLKFDITHIASNSCTQVQSLWECQT
jgi:hypothetical protein